MPILQRRVQFWAAGLAGDYVLRGLSATWRVRIIDPDGMIDSVRSGRRQVVAAFWHRQIPAIMCVHRGQAWCVPVSEHRDGEYVAHVMERHGFRAVRGSATRGGLKALRGMLAAVKEGWSLAITPDGPRGPRYAVHPGVLMLARGTGLPIYPVGVGTGRAWEFKSWDAFVVPKPFTRVVVAFGPPLVSQDVAAGDTEALCAELKARIMAATDRAQQAVGEKW